MQDLLDLMYNDDLQHGIGLNDKQLIMDEYIRRNLEGDILTNYLNLQDSMMSSRCEGEKKSYKKGFRDAIKLFEELSKV